MKSRHNNKPIKQEGDSVMDFIFDWHTAALIGAYILGYLIGEMSGRRRATNDFLERDRQMRATQMWTDNLRNIMGGSGNVKNR